MPLIPDCVPKFKINRPCTLDDTGQPTESIENDSQRVFYLIEDERHLVAHALYDNIQTRIKDWETKYNIIVPFQKTTTITTSSSSPDPVANDGTPVQNKRKLFVANRNSSSKATTTAEQSARDIQFTNLTKKMSKVEKTKFEKDVKEIEHVKRFFHGKQDIITKLEHRTKLFRTAQHNLNESDDWILASKHFGITTYYRREPDGSFAIKIEGEMEGVPLFEEICVLKEFDLFHTWAPFCTASSNIGDLDKLDQIGWFVTGLPKFGLARDACFRAIGCDNTMEDGSIFICCQGINDRIAGVHPTPENTYLSDDPIIKKLDIPPVPTRRGNGRMTIRQLDAMIRIVSPTKAETKIVANIDPNISFIPTVLIEFVMKHVTGAILGKLQQAAKKILKNPIYNPHAQLMRNEERKFYYDWLLPKFENICHIRGWELPVTPAFNLTPEQLYEEQKYIDKHGTGRSRVRNAGTSDTSSNEGDDDVVENVSDLPQYSGKNNARIINPPDLVSELSSRDGYDGRSVLSKNPVLHLFREHEEKKRRLKAAEIAAGRRRIDQLLQPKELTHDANKRLTELKRAKFERMGLPLDYVTDKSSNVTVGVTLGSRDKDDLNTLSTPKDSVSSSKLTLSQSVTKRLYSQNETTRFAVISVIVIILFTFLHGDYWIPHTSVLPSGLFHPIETTVTQRWYVVLLEDFATLVYMLVCCAIPHYILSDLVLVYAFESLQLGSKTGSHVKQFYSDTTRIIVAMISVGIVAFSVSKSLLYITYRYVLHSIVNTAPHYFSWVKESLYNLLPDSVVSVSYVVLSASRATLDALTSILLKSPLQIFYKFLFRTSFVGKLFDGLFLSVATLLGYVTDSVLGILFPGQDDIVVFTSWRRDAFTTARLLFSYTSVFLLSIIILFTISAKKQNKNLNTDDGRKKFGGTGYSTYSREFSSISLDDIVSNDETSKGSTKDVFPGDSKVDNKKSTKRSVTADSKSTEQ